jgi:hypothetical protein
MKTTTVFGGVNQKRQEAALRSGIDITFADGQRMLFSTTLDKDVSTLVSRFLHNEGLRSIGAPTSHGSDMTHHPFETSTDDKTELTHHLAPGTGRASASPGPSTAPSASPVSAAPGPTAAAGRPELGSRARVRMSTAIVAVTLHGPTRPATQRSPEKSETRSRSDFGGSRTVYSTNSWRLAPDHRAPSARL